MIVISQVWNLKQGQKTIKKKEDDMENAVMATQMLANLGIFLGAIGVLWFVTVYRDKKD
ncbi:MAG: hypothetical protein JSW42_11005 [Chloroflexota bacterium]|jgi:hypothetical protein|nr:MAG: hypothetical protein JSW42_11005 [Chloroflexota bacterium]